MSILFQVFTLVFLLYEGVQSEICSDCVKLQRCPKIMEVVADRANRNMKTMEMIRNAICGNEINGKHQDLKVCCSLFTSTFNNEAGIQQTSDDNRIDDHTSLNVLPEECGAIVSDRLVGTTIAELYQFPWTALIALETRDGPAFKCTGSIINKRYILTAAHCVTNGHIAGVRVGEYNMNTDIDCEFGVCERHIQDIPVQNSVIHEDYRRTPSIINDIALLRLAEDIDFNHKNVNPICLPTTSELRQVALDNKMGTVTGWGLVGAENNSQVLRYLRARILTAQNCSNIYNNSRVFDADATFNRLCAALQHGDPCLADPGSPLMVEQRYNNHYRYVQYGIISMEPQTCASDLLLIYTEVTKFMGWILDNISP